MAPDNLVVGRAAAALDKARIRHRTPPWRPGNCASDAKPSVPGASLCVPSFRGQQRPDRRRQIAHRGIQAERARADSASSGFSVICRGQFISGVINGISRISSRRSRNSGASPPATTKTDAKSRRGDPSRRRLSRLEVNVCRPLERDDFWLNRQFTNQRCCDSRVLAGSEVSTGWDGHIRSICANVLSLWFCRTGSRGTRRQVISRSR